jgi:putative FmdB family regulatory protein
MPTYDYVCDACEHEFELYQGINDPKKRKCPECGKLKLRRLLGTGAAVVFKGSGFYQTDYRSESYKKAQAADKPKDSGGDASKGGKEKTSGAASEGGSKAKSAGATSKAVKKSKD